MIIFLRDDLSKVAADLRPREFDALAGLIVKEAVCLTSRAGDEKHVSKH